MRVRSITAAVVALLLSLAVAACGSDDGNSGSKARSVGSTSLLFDSFGGNFQSQQASEILRPFTRETGINVTQRMDGEDIYAKVKRQVQSGRGGIDLFHADSSWVPRGAKDGILEPIDYGNLKNVDQLFPQVAQKYGARILYWSHNITYSTEVFSRGHPRTWAEVWRYAASHPKRVALWGGRPNYIIEVALLADGVAPTDLYPLTPAKIDRAYKSLDKIKKDVIFYDDGTNGDRLFSSQVDLGMYYGGNVQLLRDKGVPLGIEYNQGIYTSDFWAIPKNAPHKDAAYKLLDYALQAEHQARFALVSKYGFVNRSAEPLIDDRKALRRLPSYPPNKDRMVQYDYNWWGQHDNEELLRWNSWLRG